MTAGKCSIPLADPQNGNSDLVFSWAARAQGSPAKRLFGLNRASVALFLFPSTPRGLPAPRSNAAARSRNSQQSTQRLSIRDEGGYRFTAPGRGAGGSRFFEGLLLGRE